LILITARGAKLTAILVTMKAKHFVPGKSCESRFEDWCEGANPPQSFSSKNRGVVSLGLATLESLRLVQGQIPAATYAQPVC
jgi:hypothetical protein